MESTNFTVCLHNVYWRANDDSPEPNKTCPRAGEIRRARIENWHQTPLGGRVWLLFQPTLSCLDGWDEYPQELDESAVVECEIITRHETEWHLERARKSRSEPEARATLEGLEKIGIVIGWPPDDEYYGNVEVVCHKVVPLAQIPYQFPPTQSPKAIGAGAPIAECQSVIVETEELIYTFNSYGEARAWWVVTKTSPRRLVLYSFEIGRDACEIHNAILPD